MLQTINYKNAFISKNVIFYFLIIFNKTNKNLK